MFQMDERCPLCLTRLRNESSVSFMDLTVHMLCQYVSLSDRANLSICKLQVSITVNIVKGLYDGITTAELDEFAANYASTLASQHPDFGVLAGRIAVSNLHKQTQKSFSHCIDLLYNSVDQHTGMSKPQIAQDVYEIVMKHKDVRF